MAEFIDFEAEADDMSDDKEIEIDDPMMIDDSEDQINNEPSFVRFHNQTTNTDEVLARIAEEERIAIQSLEPTNYLEEYEEFENEIDDVSSSLNNKEKFMNTLKNPVEEQNAENSFFSALIYAINFSINKETKKFEDEVLRDKIGDDFYQKLEQKKQICVLNLDRADFDNMCFDINEILAEHNSFLRVYERKDKFRYLFHRTDEKNETIKSTSSCMRNKFNGFNVVAPYLENKIKKDLRPIDIIYEPVRNQNDVIKCYFSIDIKLAYRARAPKKNKMVNNVPHECYYCVSFFASKQTFETHIKSCSGKPGMVYSFNIQNIVTFEENLKYMGDLPFSAYADFETTAPAADYLCPENNKMFAVSYSIVFAWHPKLNLPRQCVVRGCNHSIDQLADMSHLTDEQLALRKQTTAEQLRDAVIAVHEKKSKNAIAELFNIELKFTCDLLTKWFNYKIKSDNLAVSEVGRLLYDRQKPITPESKCRICHFPLNVSPKGLSFKQNEMSYLDFLIRKEHSFIRNIFSQEELKKSKNIATLQSYQSAMELFIHLVKIAENEIKNVESYDMIYDEKLESFLKETCPVYEHDLEGLVSEIKLVEIKNNSSKLPKFTIKMYAFFYDCLMDFPACKFNELKIITTKGMFEKFYRVINSKIHLHHSHVSGEIIGHAHNFCNWKVRENKNEVPLIGHNFLGFDIFYKVKGYRSCCWGTN